MLAVDTNILIRFMVDDPGAPQQTQAARKLAQTAKKIYVSQIVQVECVWVLQTVYGFGKAEIVRNLGQLADNLRIQLQEEQTFLDALRVFRDFNADFPDCLIWAESQAVGLELATFDRKLGKLPRTKLLRA